METNMKIDVEKSVIYRFDDRMDLSEAVLMLGEKGYFSDNEVFSNYITGTLVRVICWFDQAEFTFSCKNEETSEVYRYFIPENKVVFNKEKKKKLRPYKDVREFCKNTGCKITGSHCITIRCKDSKHKAVLLYTGFCDDSVHLGGYVLTLESLFDHYEFLCKGNWMPFAVEE